MPKHHFPGEPLNSVFPAEVEVVEFHGVEVLRLYGTEAQVSETTKMLDELYPDDDKRTFCDAEVSGFVNLDSDGKRSLMPMYELIVLRKVTRADNRFRRT